MKEAKLIIRMIMFSIRFLFSRHKKVSAQLLCWRCGYLRYEWLGWHYLIENRGRCFYCRIDALDKEYGPSMFAIKSKNGSYSQPVPTRWELIISRQGFLKK